jgi:16S rRNA (uracil1498-N3)-methyltransferase
MSDRFYTEHDLSPGELVLEGDEVHHMTAVRRFEPGERVVMFNGDGAEYPSEIVTVNKNKLVILRVLERRVLNRELPNVVHVASALPKGDRTDFLIEKLVEVGATRFTPLTCHRSVVLAKDNKIDKLRRAVTEASKQCGRNKLMEVENNAQLAFFLQRSDLPVNKLFLHTDPTLPASDPGELSQGVVVCVGPEGGFTDDEVADAIAHGWKPYSLGPRILRVETAAITAAIKLAGRE